MSLMLRCSECGKLMPKPGDGSDRVMCNACGTWLAVPEVPGKPPEPDAAPQKAAASPRKTPESNKSKQTVLWATVAASVTVLLLAAVVITIVMRGRRGNEEAQYWAENRERILTLKGEAEKLAIAGELADAHAKYQEIEKIAAGRKLTDTALWDLTERAKHDQDRIYAMLTSERAAQTEAAAEDVASARTETRGQENAPP